MAKQEQTENLEEASNPYGWFLGGLFCLAGGIVFLSLSRTPSSKAEGIAFLVVSGCLLIAAVTLSSFGVRRCHHVYRGLSIACCAASSLALVANFIAPAILVSQLWLASKASDSEYEGDPSSFVKEYGKESSSLVLNGEEYECDLLDHEGKVSEAIQSVTYKRLKEKPAFSEEARFFQYSAPSQNHADLYLSEEGYAVIDILPDEFLATALDGYYSLDASMASHILDVVEEVVADDKAVHEKAKQKAIEDSDLPHFIEAMKKRDGVWMKNGMDGYERNAKDDGSVLQAIESSHHELLQDYQSNTYLQEQLVYNDDAWYSSPDPEWYYVLFETRDLAEVTRYYKDSYGQSCWMKLYYQLPREDGDAIWNALAALSTKISKS